jgi:D-amino-acid dehydrogenase
MLGVDSCVPVALPGTLVNIPAMLMSAAGPLSVHLPTAVKAIPWFALFALSAKASRAEECSRALHSLQRELKSAYDVLLDLSGAHDLVRNAGKIHLCESEAVFQKTEYARSLQRDNGIEFTVLDPADVNELAPALTSKIACGIYYPNPSYCILPLAMVNRFVDTFVALGGEIVRDDVRDIELGPSGPTSLCGIENSYPVDRLVLSAGIGSGRFANKLGAHVPMIAQRGYNTTFPVLPNTLSLPVKSEDRNILLTPMQNGIRVTGIAEIAAPGAPPTPGLIDRIVAHTRHVLPDLETEPIEPWMGSRPCTPDSLPVIGASPRFPSAILAFGHGHLGFGLGAITGRVVSELLTTGRPSVDLAPFRPDRFRSAFTIAAKGH